MVASCMDVFDHENLLFSILGFLDDLSRQNVLFVNRSIYHRLTTDEAFRWRLERLEEEHGVYFGGSATTSTGSSMRQLFLNHFQLRHMWKPQLQREPSSASETFQTETCVRFKPYHPAPESAPALTSTLPLSQRLTLLRLHYNLSSNQEALKLLGKQGGIGCFHDDSEALNIPSLTYSSSEDSDTTPSPTDLPQSTSTLTTGIHTIDATHNRVIAVDRHTGLKEFPFDAVLDPTATQQETYQRIGHKAVRDLLCGYHSTVLMYGQTGSGKTHTMMGGTGSNEEGLLPRAIREIFEAIEQRSQNSNKIPIDSSISIAYVEIFGTEVTDLLNHGLKVAQNKAAAHKMVLEGHASHQVDSLEAAIALLKQGERQKKVAATAMNERSSRAHSLFFLTLAQSTRDGIVQKESRLVLGDLGGAEQLKKSQNTADSNVDWKARTREAIHINCGLLALKNCVDALNDPKKRRGFVPYGDSKLTLLLAPNLAHTNCKTTIVVCATPDPQHATECMASLQFAQACRGIQKSYSHGNSDERLLRGLLEDLDERIETCRETIRREERWETVQAERSDGAGGTEVYTVSRLEGAEQHNQELERLLRRRGELTGTPWDG